LDRIVLTNNSATPEGNAASLVQVVDVVGGGLLFESIIGGGVRTAVAASPDGRRIAIGSIAGNPRVDVVSLASGRIIGSMTLQVPSGQPLYPIGSIAWSSNGQMLAIGTQSGTLEVYQITLAP
jgi:WD40 repeat protein